MTRKGFAALSLSVWMHLSKEPSNTQGQWRATENTPPSTTSPPKSNHFTTLETTTNSQVQQKRDHWAWMKRAVMRLPNPVAKKQGEAWEDGRMSCSSCRDSGFCSNLISPFNSFLDLNTRHPEYMSLPPKQGSNYPKNWDVLNGGWNKHSLEGSFLLILNNRVLMTELVTPLRCIYTTSSKQELFLQFIHRESKWLPFELWKNQWQCGCGSKVSSMHCTILPRSQGKNSHLADHL